MHAWVNTNVRKHRLNKPVIQRVPQASAMKVLLLSRQARSICLELIGPLASANKMILSKTLGVNGACTGVILAVALGAIQNPMLFHQLMDGLLQTSGHDLVFQGEGSITI